MERETSAKRTGVGTRADRDTAARKAWDRPRLTTIDIEDAQGAFRIATDGLYSVS